MRKYIDRKLYDTETAQEVGHWDNGLGWNDFDFVDETLYRKRTGEFFIHGEGGSRTIYAESLGGGSYCGGEAIVPVSDEEARDWAEEHLGADEVEAVWGACQEDEDGEKAVVSARLGPVALRALDAEAARLGCSRSAAVEAVLERLDVPCGDAPAIEEGAELMLYDLETLAYVPCRITGVDERPDCFEASAEIRTKDGEVRETVIRYGAGADDAFAPMGLPAASDLPEAAARWCGPRLEFPCPCPCPCGGLPLAVGSVDCFGRIVRGPGSERGTALIVAPEQLEAAGFGPYQALAAAVR